SGRSVALVEGCLERARDVAGRAGQLTLTLPGAVTGRLLTRVPAAFHGGINDVLLTALVVAIADWSRRRGGATSRAVVIDLEGHGREEPSAGRGVLWSLGVAFIPLPVRACIRVGCLYFFFAARSCRLLVAYLPSM